MSQVAYRCIQYFFDTWRSDMDWLRVGFWCKYGTIFSQRYDNRMTAQTQKVINCTFGFPVIPFKNALINMHSFEMLFPMSRNTHSIFGTGRLLIAAASTWLIHRIVGNVNSSKLISFGAGAALSIEMPSLKRRRAANVACKGVSNWQTNTLGFRLVKKQLILANGKCWERNLGTAYFWGI